MSESTLDRSAIDALRAGFERRLADAGTDQALKAVHDEFLSRKSGSITALLKTLATLPPEHKRTFGALVNDVKAEIETRLADKRQLLEQSRPPAGAVDVTLPGRSLPYGRADARPPAGGRRVQPHGIRDPRGP